MRDINRFKFRAWDKSMQFMHDEFYISGYGGVFIHPEKTYDIPCTAIDHDEDNLIVMQFTGLTDKNGVDIYEGAVVKQYYTPLGKHPKATYFLVGVIVYEKNSFAIDWKIRECKYEGLTEEQSKNPFLESYREKWEHPTSSSWVDLNISNVEVIGTKFEDKQLIEND